jgi:hypothetical protein
MLAANNDSIMHYLYNANSACITAITKAKMTESHQQLWSAYYYFWEGLNSDNKQSIKTSSTLLERACQNIHEEDSAFILMRIMQVRMAVMRGKYISALSHQRDIKRYLRSTNNTSENKQLVTGMYNYFSAQARSESVLNRLILKDWPPGNRQEGIDQLIQLSTRQSAFIATEAHYFLGRIYLEYENDIQKAFKHFDMLNKEYPNNAIFKLFLEQCKKAH